MDIAVTVGLTFFLALTIARVEHIIASDIWILRRGQEFKRIVTSLARKAERKGQQLDPDMRWQIYKNCGGWRLPWLFLGIQSSRLLAWSTTSRSFVRSILLRAIRGLWRFYTYAPTVAVATCALVWLDDDLSSINSWLTLMILAILAVGCIGIAAGGVLASNRIGAFARYHHFTWPPPTRSREIALHELSLLIGSGMIAFIVATGLVFVVSVEFSGFESTTGTTPFSEHLWRSTRGSLLPFLGGEGSLPVKNGFGAFGSIAVALIQFSYAVILLGATWQAWRR